MQDDAAAFANAAAENATIAAIVTAYCQQQAEAGVDATTYAWAFGVVRETVSATQARLDEYSDSSPDLHLFTPHSTNRVTRRARRISTDSAVASQHGQASGKMRSYDMTLIQVVYDIKST